MLDVKNYTLTPEDTATDLCFSFVVSEQVKKLTICLQFNPASESDPALCRAPIIEALSQYHMRSASTFSEDDWMQFLPIKNLITLSLDQNDVYLGNAHRWDNNQTHVFTQSKCARGFSKPATLGGKWQGTLHIHEVISAQCDVTVQIVQEVDG